MIACVALLIVNVRATGAAAKSLLSPAWLAVIVQLPTPPICTELPATEHMPLAVNETGKSELAVANMILSWAPDFIVTVGDNDYGLTSDTYDPNIGKYYPA